MLVIQSISTILDHKQKFDFKLPLYIKNYLLFIGKYGDDLKKINIDETNFLYENKTIMFNPNFKEIYKNINQVSFKIYNKIYIIKKEYDMYVENDFDKFKIPIEKIDDIFTIELLIDGNLFKRFEINLFHNNFILLNCNYNIKSITNREIYIPKRDEDRNYYIISKIECNNLNLAKIQIENYFLYSLVLDINNQIININNEEYTLYYSPRIISNIEYRDNEDFLYVNELPKFQLSPKDKENFLAQNLFTNYELNFKTFYEYNDPIGKFKISINNKIFNIIYIDGFEILQWFNWYDNNKIIKIKLSSKEIKINCDKVEEEDNYFLHTFKLKKQDNTLVFNQLIGNNIHLKVLKPEIKMSFLDKRKNETKIKSKNIKYERLNFYRQLKIKLLDYPSSIKFNKIKIADKEEDVIKSSNNYFISIAKIKKILEEYDKQHVSLILKNDYYFLPITDIILENFIIKNSKQKKEIKIDDINFIMHNMDNIKYYIKNKAYFIDGVISEINYGFSNKFLIIKEIRHTQQETIIKKSFNSIKKDGLYVQLEDIDYE